MAKCMIGIYLLVFVFNYQFITLDETREIFLESGKKPELSGILNHRLSQLKSKNSLMKAYQGISMAMMARNAESVFAKYKFFVAGRDSLERALKEDPNNFEIRFLRFQFQNNIPRFLGYDHRKNDRLFLLQNFRNFLKQTENKNFSKRVMVLISESSYLNVNEQKQIKDVVEKL